MSTIEPKLKLPADLQAKYSELKNIIRQMEGLLVAFSGGVDSTLLLYTAHVILGNKVLAVTAVSDIHHAWEIEEAVDFARSLNIRHRIVQGTEMNHPEFVSNPPDRCYICKKELFGTFNALAEAEGFAVVADGANVDDDSDYRPGSRATRELGIRSPLKEAGLSKAEIRVISEALALPTWDKPALACLASRVPYGTEITRECLKQVGAAETFLRSLGFSQVRVRHHGAVARIEVPPEEISGICETSMRQRISRELKRLGYSYVSLDLEGYRTGSLNEILE